MKTYRISAFHSFRKSENVRMGSCWRKPSLAAQLPTECKLRPGGIPWCWPSEAGNELSTCKYALMQPTEKAEKLRRAGKHLGGHFLVCQHKLSRLQSISLGYGENKITLPEVSSPSASYQTVDGISGCQHPGASFLFAMPVWCWWGMGNWGGGVAALWNLPPNATLGLVVFLSTFCVSKEFLHD